MLVEAQRIALTDGIGDLYVVRLMEIDAQYIDAVPKDAGLKRVFVEDGVVGKRGGVPLYITRRPFVRQGLA